MATEQELERILGKILTDPHFRSQFAQDPSGSAGTLNIQLTSDEVQAFSANMEAFATAASDLERSDVEGYARGHLTTIQQRPT